MLQFDEGWKEFRLHATYGMSEAMITAISDQHLGLDNANIGAAAKRDINPYSLLA